jgi:hypothetical protein
MMISGKAPSEILVLADYEVLQAKTVNRAWNWLLNTFLILYCVIL